MKRIAFIILTLIVSVIACFADNVQFTASAPRVVEVGEQFEITYNISAQPSGFKPPEFKNFNLLGGPSTSTSSSFQVVNGKMSQSMTVSYAYYFSASAPGTYTIEPAKATVEGKNYLSNSLTIQVAGTAQQGNQQSGNSQGNSQKSNQPQQGNETIADVGNDDIFIRVLVDRSTLYQGEYLVAKIKLYTKLNISSIENPEYPSFNGFFRQDIETQPLRQLEREVVNGQVYSTGVIQKMVLFPEKTGEIVIDPMTLQMVVQMVVKNRRPSVFDDFFGPSVQEAKKKIKSLPVKITVKPLPYDASGTFKGAVGNFTFKASVDKQNVKTNEAINLKLVISGNGNLKILEPLEIKFPSDFETYDPKVSVNAIASVAGVSGNKTFEYLIIPRHSGNFKIPALQFTYFDTQSKQYKTLSSGEIAINVEKGLNDNATTTVVSGVDKEDVKFLGKDIQYIKTKGTYFRKLDDYLFGSPGFWLSYLISSLLFILIVVLLRKQIKENANLARVRNKKANKVAKRRLKDAHIYMKGNRKEEFYEYILKALWGYMSDKLSIPLSELSRDKLLEETGKKNIEVELVQKFMEILDTCEFARYAPASEASQMENVYSDSISVISKIEQKIK